MSFEETVTTKDGNQKRVVADSKEDLAAGVKQAKADQSSVSFDINVPVKKGHDLLTVDEALRVVPVDGTGAHNSPRDAIRDDGSVEGSDPMLVVPSANVPHAAAANQEQVVGSQETKEVDVEKLKIPSEEATKNTPSV